MKRESVTHSIPHSREDGPGEDINHWLGQMWIINDPGKRVFGEVVDMKGLNGVD